MKVHECPSCGYSFVQRSTARSCPRNGCDANLIHVGEPVDPDAKQTWIWASDTWTPLADLQAGRLLIERARLEQRPLSDFDG